MAAPVGTAFVDILPRTESFTSSLTAQLKDSIAKASSGVDAAPLTKALNAGLFTAGAAVIGGIYKGIQATQDWISSLKALQKVTGQSAEEVSRLAGAAEIMGVSTSSLTTGFTILSRNVANGSKALETYGIETRDAAGEQLPLSDILSEIQDKISVLPKGMEQTAAATALFGRGGRQLLPILTLNSEQMAELYKRAEDLGIVMSEDDFQASKELGIAQRELGLAFKGFSMTLARDFIPALTKVTEIATTLVAAFQKIPQPVVTAVAGFLAANTALVAARAIWSFFATQIATTTTMLGLNTTATLENEAASQASSGTAIATASNVEKLAVTTELDTAATEQNTIATVQSAAASTVAAGASKALTGSLDAQLIAEEGAAAGLTGGLIPAYTLASASGGVLAYVSKTLSSNLVALGAPLFAFYKGIQAAREEIAGFQTDDPARFFNAMADGASILGVTIPKVHDPMKGLNEDIANLNEGLSDGSITAAQGSEELQRLGHTYGFVVTPEMVANLKINDELNKTLEEQTADQLAAAAAATVNAHSIQQMTGHSKTLNDYLERMGMSVQAFRRGAERAFKTGNFDAWAKDFRKNAVGVWNEFHDAAQSSLSFTEQAVGELGQNLKEGQHLTAQSILKTFENARKKTQAFAKDLLAVSQIGGKAAKDLASSLLESGNVMAAQVIANAPDKLQKQIVTSFGKGETAADTWATKLTNAIVGPLKDITQVLRDIAKAWNITLTVDNSRALAQLEEVRQKATGMHIDLTASLSGSFQGRPDIAGGAHGGVVSARGIGMASGDVVPAMLTPGEFVMRRSAVQRIGIPRLRQMNRGGSVGGGAAMYGEMRIRDWRSGLAALEAELEWDEAVSYR